MLTGVEGYLHLCLRHLPLSSKFIQYSVLFKVDFIEILYIIIYCNNSREKESDWVEKRFLVFPESCIERGSDESCLYVY